MGGSTAGSAFAGGSSFRGEPNLSMSEASSTRDPTQPGLPNRREGGHCVKTRLAPVRTRAEPSLIPHAVAERLQRHQQTKRAVLGAIRKYRLDDVAAHSPFVSFRRLTELALGAHVFLAPSVTASDGDAEGTPFALQQMIATGMPAVGAESSNPPEIRLAGMCGVTGGLVR